MILRLLGSVLTAIAAAMPAERGAPLRTFGRELFELDRRRVVSR